jgi:catechol 2,3-dioxygenase-like lactoylglutathione lyase family enzyme
MHCMRTHDEPQRNFTFQARPCGKADISISHCNPVESNDQMENAMQLNHIDLSVPDVALTTSFFETGFGFEQIQKKRSNGMAILKGSDGFTLVLTRSQQSEQYPKTFHIGFLVPSEQAVVDAYIRLEVAGIEFQHPPHVVRGCLLFYCYAPGGILIEVSHRLAV